MHFIAAPCHIRHLPYGRWRAWQIPCGVTIDALSRLNTGLWPRVNGRRSALRDDGALSMQKVSQVRTQVFWLPVFSFTDPTLTAGSTVIKAVHFRELRAALAGAHAAAGPKPTRYNHPQPNAAGNPHSGGAIPVV